MWGEVVCAFLNDPNCNLNGHQFTNSFDHCSFFGRTYSSGKSLLRASFKLSICCSKYLSYPVLPGSHLWSQVFHIFLRRLNRGCRKEKGDGAELVELSIVLRIVTESFKRPLSDLSI